jgi:hypothetical protein
MDGSLSQVSPRAGMRARQPEYEFSQICDVNAHSASGPENLRLCYPACIRAPRGADSVSSGPQTGCRHRGVPTRRLRTSPPRAYVNQELEITFWNRDEKMRTTGDDRIEADAPAWESPRLAIHRLSLDGSVSVTMTVLPCRHRVTAVKFCDPGPDTNKCRICVLDMPCKPAGPPGNMRVKSVVIE